MKFVLISGNSPIATTDASERFTLSLINRGLPGVPGDPGPQGDPGPAGPPGLGSQFPINANTDLSGHRCVTASGLYCDANNASHADRLIGITTYAAMSGETVTLQVVGEMTDASFAWTTGLPVFCGAAGVLTQTFDPNWAWVQIVGVATSTNSFVINIHPAIAIV